MCKKREYETELRAFALAEEEKRLSNERAVLVKRIKEYYAIPCEPVNLANLSIEDKVYLCFLCNELKDYKTEELMSMEEDKSVLGKGFPSITPTVAMMENIYRDLLSKKVILVSANSSIEAFEKGATFPSRPKYKHVRYVLNISPNIVFEDLIEDLKPNEGNVDELLQVWKKTIIEECIAYINFLLHKKGCPELDRGDILASGLYHTLEKITCVCSTSMAFCAAYKGVEWATKFKHLEKKRNNIAKDLVFTFGSVIGGAIWREEVDTYLKGYDRPFTLPESRFSKFFFYDVLEIGFNGFQKTPRKEWIFN